MFVVWVMNGELFFFENGVLVWLVVLCWYGVVFVKWLECIEVLE